MSAALKLDALSRVDEGSRRPAEGVERLGSGDSLDPMPEPGDASLERGRRDGALWRSGTLQA